MDSLIPEAIVILYPVSRELKLECSSRFQERARRELMRPELVINNLRDYVRVMSRGLWTFVTRGSQKFIPLDEALYRTVLSGNRGLINYFLRCSPEANMGCESRHVLFTLFVSSLLGRRAIEEEIFSNLESDTLKNLRLEPENNRIVLMKPLPEDPNIMESFFCELESPSLIMFFARPNSGINPQHSLNVAACKGYLDVIKHIISSGVNVDPQYALNGAAYQGYLNIMDYLLSLKPDLDLQYPLENATLAGNLTTIKYLFTLKPDLKIQEALYVAARDRNMEVISYLLSRVIHD